MLRPQICLFIAFIWLSICGTLSHAQPLPLSKALNQRGYSEVSRAKGYHLFQKDGESMPTYIMALGIESLTISSFFEKDNELKADTGYYFPYSESPYFKRLHYPKIIEAHPSSYAILNASFFESYARSTQLSYPIYQDSMWLTSGSSPYGPIKQAAHPYYSTITLLQLNIYPTRAEIIDFNAQPVNEPKPLISLVSQNYQDHPAKVLANNRKTRFLLCTTYSETPLEDAEWILFAIGFGTIDDIALELNLIKNNDSPIMTLDGGSSVLLFDFQLGVLQKPINYTRSDSDDEMVDLLPHYLIFEPNEH